MYTKVDSTTSKYKKINKCDIAAFNKNTFYTMDKVIELSKKYITDKVEEFLGRELKAVEMPDRDVNNQMRSSSNMKRLRESSILPRAILLYEFNNEDGLVDIPSIKGGYDIMNGQNAKLETFIIPKSLNNIYNPFNDTKVDLIGKINWTQVNIYYSILFDNKVEPVELQKLLSRLFIPESMHEIYNKILKTDKVGEDMTGYTVDNYSIVPYDLETDIPTEIIERLREYFKSDHELNDSELARVLSKYSTIQPYVSGSTGTKRWQTKYPTVPILVPISPIERSDDVKGMEKTSMLRMSFQLNYIELSAFQLRNSMSILSNENPNNLVNRDFNTRDITMIKKPLEVNGCTESFYMILKLTEDDIVDGVMKVDIRDFCESYELYFKSFMQFINDSNYIEETDMYNVIVKHMSNQSESLGEMSSTGCYYSYDDYAVFDGVSKPGDSICVLMYVNETKFNEWKVSCGLTSKDNASMTYLK